MNTPTKPRFDLNGEGVMSKAIRFVLMTITPKMAESWLERNHRNRPLKDSVVRRYERAMRDGRFRVTAQAIVFDWNGDLLDGQHRLWACVVTGKEFQAWVAFDEDPANFPLYDIGKKRSGSDNLALLGYKDANNLAAAAAHVWRYERGVFFIGTRALPDNEEIIATVEAHPSLQQSTTFVGPPMPPVKGGGPIGPPELRSDRPLPLAPDMKEKPRTVARLWRSCDEPGTHGRRTGQPSEDTGVRPWTTR